MWKQSKKCSVTWYFKKNYSAVHSFVHVLMYWEERSLLNTVIHEQMSSICCYSFISYSSSIRWKRNREEEKKEPRKKIFQKEHNKQTVSCVFVCVHACMYACMMYAFVVILSSLCGVVWRGFISSSYLCVCGKFNFQHTTANNYTILSYTKILTYRIWWHNTHTVPSTQV